MMTSRIKSVANIEMTFTVLFVMLGIAQKPPSEIHEERIYGQISSKCLNYSGIVCSPE